MAEIINLRRERKARKRAEASREAEQLRARHGQTKAQSMQTRQAKTKNERDLDGKRLRPKD